MAITETTETPPRAKRLKITFLESHFTPPLFIFAYISNTHSNVCIFCIATPFHGGTALHSFGAIRKEFTLFWSRAKC